MQVEDPAASLGGALPLVLQHASLVEGEDAKLLCKLLCVCQTWRAGLDAHCTGHFPLVVLGKAWMQCAEVLSWIESHGYLLSRIELCLPAVDSMYLFGNDDWLPDFVIAFEAALAAAAASPEGLNLRALRVLGAFVHSPSILQHLPPKHLTNLQLQLSSYSSSTAPLPALFSRTCSLGSSSSYAADPPLSLFTNLQSLTLEVDHGSLGNILPALRQLTQLTHLDLCCAYAPEEVDERAELRLLLPQIVELRIYPQCSREAFTGGKVQLSHMTAVSALEWWEIEPEDELPPNLTSLSTTQCPSLDPLRPLQQLRLLNRSPEWPAQTLRLLPSILPSLQEIGLSYSTADSAAAAAPAWSQPMPAVTSLHLYSHFRHPGGPDIRPIPRSVMQQVPSLGGTLQTLDFTTEYWEPLCVDVTPGELAAILAKLTALTSLNLTCIHLAEVEGVEEEDKQRERVMMSIGGLYRLKFLAVPCGWGVGSYALHLTRLTSMQGLHIRHSSLTDLAVCALAVSMKQLTSLELSGNESLTGSFMPAIGLLTQLRELDLPMSPFADESIGFLTGCISLRTLWLPSNLVSAEAREALQAAMPKLMIR